MRKKDIEFKVEKTPLMWRRKNHEKTYLLCGTEYKETYLYRQRRWR
jgi:hypothetical protein